MVWPMDASGHRIRFRLSVMLGLAVRLVFLITLPDGHLPAAELADSGRHARGLELFEKKIRPVLVKHCYECHAESSDVVQAGLKLDQPQHVYAGGDSGAVIVPGKPEESLLLQSLRYEGPEMPPSGRLDERTIADFERWIAAGAQLPGAEAMELVAAGKTGSTDEAPIDWEQARSYWAFQRPQFNRVPEISVAVASNNFIDPFVERARAAAGLSANPPTDRRTLIRRISLDLTGLPPRPAQIERFLRDDHPDAYRRLVDRLLASPEHAEHWTRLWLDVARYAEDQAHKVGNNDALTYPNAYLYRDWVIGALADDMPYDDFVRMQLAADHFAADQPDEHLALGFLGLGPKYYRRNSPEVMADEWEDRVDTVTRGLLGLTVSCARCHDHKYDPVPTSDYYSLAGIFAGTDMYNRPLDESVETKNGQAAKPQDAAHIVRDGKPRDLHVMIRGDVNREGELAPRGFLTVLSRGNEKRSFERGSGRADLAEAIVDPQNPLTARVIVNRVWRKLMGRGLVETPSNFGRLGERPTHPELLDALAVRFMDEGYSLKWLQRAIVTSATYRQSSVIRDEALKVDPSNRLLWRMSRKRLSIEQYRDSVLSVAGRLDERIGGTSIQPNDPESTRRTLYSEVSRMDLNPLLARFDFPDPNAHCAKRVETTTPLQKLFLLNSEFILKQASAFADRMAASDESLDVKLDRAHRLVFGRPITDAERNAALAFVADDRPDQWVQYAQVLLISNEMLFVD
jgi:mono/diheme cytochrome c family protein